MTELVKLKAQKREELGTGNARAVRRSGMVTAEVYGNGKDNLSVVLAENEMTKLYRQPGFTSTILEIDVDGKSYKVVPKSVQLHPLNDLVRHVDFIHLDKKEQRVDVQVKFTGKEKSIGLKRGGFLNIVKRKIELLCDINKIPQNVSFDIEELHVGSTIRAKDLTIPEGSKMLNSDNLVIASITGRKSKDDAEESPDGTSTSE